MKTIHTKAILTAVLALSVAALFALGATAQEKKKANEEEPTALKPGTEHELLKKEAGVWDAVVEESSEPGQPPKVSKGVETNTLICNGLWLVTDFKGEMMGQPFQGHGVTGYDASKKKYTGVWVDGMSAALGLLEGTYDATKKTLTNQYESHDPQGNPVKMKMVTTWKDDNTRDWNASMVGPDGKEMVMLTIHYKRKK